jgi:hypothetical protein
MACCGAQRSLPWRVAELEEARHGVRTRGGREGGGAGYRGGGGAPGKEEATGASEVDGGAPLRRLVFFCFSFFLFFSPSFVCFFSLFFFFIFVLFFLHAAERVVLPSSIYTAWPLVAFSLQRILKQSFFFLNTSEP